MILVFVPILDMNDPNSLLQSVDIEEAYLKQMTLVTNDMIMRDNNNRLLGPQGSAGCLLPVLGFPRMTRPGWRISRIALEFQCLQNIRKTEY